MAPFFLSRSQINEAHRMAFRQRGGLMGLVSEHALESALAVPQNDFYYAEADLFGIAAAYAFHIAQAQAFLDGNKRTAIEAAFVFLEVNGMPTDKVDTLPLHEDLKAEADHQMTKKELADRFRKLFAPPAGAETK